MSKVKLVIMTPEGIFWNKDVSIVTVKTTTGYIGLQKNKSPFIAPLDIAEIHINSKNEPGHKVAAVAGGLVIASRSEIRIISEAIEYKDKIDLRRAQQALKKAQALVNANKSASEALQAQVALKKALNRINVRENAL